MTNEQLATLIHTGGNDELIPLLWEKVRALMYMKAGQYYRTHSETCAARGVQLWDIKQAGYLAYIAALKAFNPESGLKFLSYISFPFRNEVNELLRIRSRKADALNKSISLDAPIKNDEGEDTTLGDLQPDAQSMDFVERLEAAMISVSMLWRLKISATSEIRSVPRTLISSSLPRNGLTNAAPALAQRRA